MATRIGLLAVLALLAGALAAQGIVIDRRIRPPHPMPRPIPVQPIRVKSHAVDALIEGQSATVTVTQTFFNPNSWQLEGTYLFPLPAKAAISKFEMTMNGKMVTGEVLPADKARAIYEQTVRQMIDPGLLEFAGRGMFRARVFPILPQQDLTVRFTYSELLRFDSGLVRFAYPLRTRHFSATAPDVITARVTVKSDRALHTVYSPTHTVEVVRKGAQEAVVGLEMKGEQPAHDLEVYFGYADGPLAASVLSYREGQQPGYFLALLTPKIELEAKDVLPKDVVIVLDTSGSMDEDGKIAQARRALKFIVNKLNDDDRFALVTFATVVRKHHDSLVAASAENRAAAIERIDALQATGGTNIEGAIRAAFEIAAEPAKRPCYVLFLTDGLPTMGEVTDVRALASIAREKRPQHVRMFTFGVGFDVNTWLLDTLSEEGRGQREYVKPKEDMEVKVSNFAAKIAAPVLSDVKLRIDGAEVHDLHPQTPGDMFAGTQIAVLGRFDKPGKRQLVLEGTVNGETRAFEYGIELTENDTAKSYLPRMWAVRRVGFLMDQITLKGHNEELAKEIVRLGTQFGIVTPYTSFLIVEDGPPPPTGRPLPPGHQPQQPWGRGPRGEGAPAPEAPPAPGAQTGSGAVRRSEADRDRRAADNAAEAEKRADDGALRGAHGDKGRASARERELKRQGLDDETARREAAQVVRTVGTRTFVWSDTTWVESDLTNAEIAGAESVEYLSERYFELLRTDDATARVFALGPQVIARIQGKTVRVIEKSPE